MEDVVQVGTYADKDGKINKLPACYIGDMELPEGKGDRCISVSKICESVEVINKGLTVTL